MLGRYEKEWYAISAASAARVWPRVCQQWRGTRRVAGVEEWPAVAVMAGEKTYAPGCRRGAMDSTSSSGEIGQR